jgi:hypothetical protein
MRFAAAAATFRDPFVAAKVTVPPFVAKFTKFVFYIRNLVERGGEGGILYYPENKLYIQYLTISTTIIL